MKEELRARVLAAGFDAAGFARAGRAPDAGRLAAWLAAGFAAGMDYMARTAEARTDTGRVLPGARTAIAVALFYRRRGESSRSAASSGEARALARSGRGEIAAYARGRDYHRLMTRRLRRLAAALRLAFPGESFRPAVDTAPVLERSWAAAAGLGWIGKNACAIDPREGSHFFIGVVLTTLEVPPDAPLADRCGSCRRCLDACPTGALVEPYRLDARRCLSYQTIENRGEIPEELRPAMGGLVFGCDICQEVCPYNRPEGGREEGGGRTDPALAARLENVRPELGTLLRETIVSYDARFAGSAARRARRSGMIRNLLVAVGNGGRAEDRALLDWAAGRPEVAEDPVVREALGWARGRLKGA